MNVSSDDRVMFQSNTNSTGSLCKVNNNFQGTSHFAACEMQKHNEPQVVLRLVRFVLFAGKMLSQSCDATQIRRVVLAERGTPAAPACHAALPASAASAPRRRGHLR